MQVDYMFALECYNSLSIGSKLGDSLVAIMDIAHTLIFKEQHNCNGVNH